MINMRWEKKKSNALLVWAWYLRRDELDAPGLPNKNKFLGVKLI